ncbi:transmembrane protein 141-like [Daphnia carinata]|uniref:transmembrane protein 141-like n=1 Tax=Daphnia carinata TaxID=120202 RepID=UPI0025810920|nr:transmembrane protein 141-like [Daphnia carinata]
MNNVSELKSRYTQIYPAFGSYTECMSRALFTGLSSTILGFSTAFCVQNLLKKRLPYPISGNILVSSFVAVVVGFKVTSVRAQSCQAAWLAAEEKHTFFTENDTKSN